MKKEGSGKINLLYYFYGEEDYLIEEAVEGIKTRVIPKGFESMNYHVYDSETLNPEELIETARTLPAFSSMRLIVVKEAESLKAEKIKELEGYLKNPSPSTCLAFIAYTWKIRKDTFLFKHIQSIGGVKEWRRLTDMGVSIWIKDYAKKEGKEIREGAIRRFLSVVGNSLRDVKGELDKLVTFVGAEMEIKEEDVERSALGINYDNAFDLADAIGRKDPKNAFKVLQGLDEEPLQTLGAIAWQIRLLLKVKAYIKEGVQRGRLLQLLRISENRLNRYEKASGNFSEKELLDILSILSKADMELKGDGLPDGMVLSGLVMKLCRTNKNRPQARCP